MPEMCYGKPQVPEYPNGKAWLPFSPCSHITPGMPGNSLLPSVPFNPNGCNCCFFIPRISTVQSLDSLFLGHTRCHRGEALSWSCRSRGYQDGCTTAACMDQRFGTERHNSHETNAEHEIIYTFWVSKYFCILFILYLYLLFYLYFSDKDPTCSVDSISHTPMSPASSGQCLFPASLSPGLVRRGKKTPRSGTKMRFFFFLFFLGIALTSLCHVNHAATHFPIIPQDPKD